LYCSCAVNAWLLITAKYWQGVVHVSLPVLFCSYFFLQDIPLPIDLFIMDFGDLTVVILEAGTAFVIFFFIVTSWFWNVACVPLLLALSRLI